MSISSGYVLVIAEKAKAAGKIAYALSRGRASMKRFRGIPYWDFRVDGRRYVVAPAAGHLFGLHSRDRGFPTFSYEWAPLWMVDRKAKHLKRYYEALKALCSRASYFINACDYDIEGSVIGYMIIRFLGDPKRAGRMKFSSLTPDELRSSFTTASKSLDWPMIEAGLCRHELDWMWGINTSRALMYAVRIGSGRRLILSAGRVQSPTLVNVSEREIDRETYVPSVYFKLSVKAEIEGKLYSLEYLGETVRKMREAREIVEKVRSIGYGRVVKIDSLKEKRRPPPPFNLGDLQSEASRIYGYSPYETQRLAEELYLDALISYPRTNSQKLPPTLNYGGILSKLSRIPEYSDLVEMLLFETEGRLKPRQGRKEDPAHPAIYPTGLPPKSLSGKKKAIYDLVVRRFLACFSSDYVISKVTVYIDVDGVKFRLQSRVVDDYGWTKYYHFIRESETSIPKLKIGDRIKIVRASFSRAYTSPPQRPTKTDVLKWMESVNIGTEATRARIIETLFSRGYLRLEKGRVRVTDLGLSVARTLKEFFSDLASVELTRRFEAYIEEIRSGKKSRSEVVEEAKATISKILMNFRVNAHNVGLEFSKSLGLIRPERPCIICGREVVEGKLCTYHLLAYRRVLESYDDWKDALDGIEFKSYLEALSKTANAGRWAREVAVAMLEGKIES